MALTIEKSFEWLFNRFKSPQLKPCKFDFDCLTFLAEWANREKEKNKQENILFAKLYVHLFIQEIRYYKDIEFAKKSMNDILNLDLHSHYVLFKERLNDIEFNKYLLSVGINTEKILFPVEVNGEYKETEAMILEKNKLKEATEFFKNVNKWNTEQIEKSLNAQITESINRFDKKP